MNRTEKAVNMGEIGLSTHHRVLTCYALGSCVGVAIYDPSTKIGGLAHVVLPSDVNFHTYKENNGAYLLSIDLQGRPAKFADSGLAVLVNKLEKSGAKPHNLQAKIVGGARLLPSFYLNSDGLEIGKQNEVAVRQQLDRLDIPIVASDVGGTESRTMRFYPLNGNVEIWRVGSGKIVI